MQTSKANLYINKKHIYDTKNQYKDVIKLNNCIKIFKNDLRVSDTATLGENGNPTEQMGNFASDEYSA